MAAIYSLYIINKSGGLIFYKDYGSAGRMDTNDTLRVASLWHSMHAISQQLSPVVGCAGIELLEADTFDLHCLQSLTAAGTVMFIFTYYFNLQSMEKDTEANKTQIDDDVNMEEVGVLGNGSQAPVPPLLEDNKRTATGRKAVVWEHFKEPYMKNDSPSCGAKFDALMLNSSGQYEE